MRFPASDAFEAWLQQQRSSGSRAFADSQTLTKGLNLARARAQEMRALMERDPQEFVHRAMSETARTQLPTQLQPFVEKRVSGRGFFAVSCSGLPREPEAEPAGSHPHGGYAYEVRLNGTTYRACVFGKWRDQSTVYEANIEGVVLDDAIAVGDALTPTEQVAAGQSITAYTPTVTGPNTLLYLVARFSDQSSDPIADSTVLSQMAVVSNFWMNCSGGSVYLHGLVNPNQVVDIVHITLPQPASYAATYKTSFAQLLSDARNAAQAQGFNYANYNLDVVVTSNSGFGYAGYSYIGAQGSHWVAGYTSLRTAGHELGHNLGLYHANYWRTDSTAPFGKDSNPGGYVADNVNGEWVEYGHYFSLMSAQYGSEWEDATMPIYNPAEKVRLGWLTGSQVQYVTSSGTYRLFRHDARATVGTPRAIRIETPATDYTSYGRRYWLQYRFAPWSAAQTWFQNGLEIDVAQPSYGSSGSIQLDMSPYSNDQSSPFYNASSPPGGWWTIDNCDKVDGALLIGRTYDDRNAGIHITPIAKGNNGVGEEYLDVVINVGAFAANHAPVISSFSASAFQVAANQVVNFSVTATDPDGEALAYSWDFDEVQSWTDSGLNRPTAVKSWSSPGQYRIVVRVSDMKGGVTTASQIVTVGAPAATAQIWGRVLWGGQPVLGARVSTTQGSTAFQAWTESDGSYVLTGLSAGSPCTLNCASAGLTFTAQFANPVSLATGNFYGADFYANEPMGASGQNTYTLSGQVTDPVNPVAGIEVRAGGLVAVTDAAGNYQLTNFLNGTYAVVPTGNGWTFSPASRTVSINSASSTGNNFARVAPYCISGSFSGIAAGSQSPAPTVYLSNGRSVQATRQGSGGNRYWGYTLNDVPAGQYGLSAAVSGYQVVPLFSNPLSVAGNLSSLNFTGLVASVAGAITGRITQQGLAVPGVTVQVLQGGTLVSAATSDSDGYYRLENLSSGAYTVSPARAGFCFSPVSAAVSGVPANNLNFAATGPYAPPVLSSLTASPTVVSSVSANTTLSVLASGSGTLLYTWDALSAPAPVSFSTNNCSGAAVTTVTFQAPGRYTFRSRVTDGNGLWAAGNLDVTVNAGPGALAVTPYQVQVAAGQTVAFQARAWDQLGNPISVSPVWSASGGGAMDANGRFTATASGGPFSISAVAGTLSATGLVWVTSGPAEPPLITTQPLGQCVTVGTNVTFCVVASGTDPLSYQWLLNGEAIAGATQSAYTLTNVQCTDAGSYSVQVTNPAGSAVSASALLTVSKGTTCGLLSSSSNPALPNQAVIFTFSVNPDAPSTGVPTGTVQFKVDGSPADAPVPLSNGIASYSTCALTHGTHTVVAEYAGDAQFIGTTNQLSPVQLLNSLPVAGADTVERISTNGVTVPLATLLTNDFDPDGDPIFLLDVSATSANGGTVVSNAGSLFYTPAAGSTNTDTFTYTLSDGYGTPVTGRVTVNVLVDAGPPPNLTLVNLGEGSYSVRGTGIPGQTYRIQFADSPQSANWQTLGTAMANPAGIFELIDTSGSAQRYYRSVYP